MATTIRAEFDEYYVKDLNEYNNTILTLFEDFAEIYFRGVDQARYNLSPSISRNMPNEFSIEKELELFDAFKRRIAVYKNETYREYIGQFAHTDLETMAIAQHHSLKTRFLDWSTNPLASLWFACEKPTSADPDTYCVVWVLTAPKERKYRTKFFKADSDVSDLKKQFTIPESFMYIPNIVNPRIKNQSALFSVHHYDESNKRFVPLDENEKFFPHKFKDITYKPEQHWNLIKILINRDLYVDNILKNLSRFDVNEESIYPSLERASKRLNFDYQAGWVW